MNSFSKMLLNCGALLFLALTGCFSVSVPLKPAVVGQNIKPVDLAWIRPNQTTRQEIEANWGPPSVELREERLLGYTCTIDRSASWQFWHVGADPVINDGTWGTASRSGAFFAFDAEDKIVKCEIVPLVESMSSEAAAKDWLMGIRTVRLRPK